MRKDKENPRNGRRGGTSSDAKKTNPNSEKKSVDWAVARASNKGNNHAEQKIR